MKSLFRYCWVVVVFTVISCEFAMEGFYSSFSVTFKFDESAQDWRGDFADYPEGDSIDFALQVSHELLPSSINLTPQNQRKGIYITGKNESDDLFMFITRKLTGLKPNTNYEILFNVKFASNVPTGAVGIGGAPGESVYVKVGATNFVPKKLLVDGMYRMNLDKGAQSTSGEDMIVIGHVGVAATTTTYKEITRYNTSSNPVIVKSSNTGELWLIVGTDSGFEGTTALYYTQIDVLFNEY